MSQKERDKNCKDALVAMRLCTNVLSFDRKLSETEIEFLKFCEEIGSIVKHVSK